MKWETYILNFLFIMFASGGHFPSILKQEPIITRPPRDEWIKIEHIHVLWQEIVCLISWGCRRQYRQQEGGSGNREGALAYASLSEPAESQHKICLHRRAEWCHTRVASRWLTGSAWVLAMRSDIDPTRHLLPPVHAPPARQTPSN